MCLTQFGVKRDLHLKNSNVWLIIVFNKIVLFFYFNCVYDLI